MCEQIASIVSGFEHTMPYSPFCLIPPSEASDRITGRADITVAYAKAHVFKLSQMDTVHEEQFWSAFSSLSTVERCNFVEFAYGGVRAPATPVPSRPVITVFLSFHVGPVCAHDVSLAGSTIGQSC